jgi:hypothetical protein
MVMRRATRRGFADIALVLSALPLVFMVGCGKKEEPTGAAPPANQQYTTPEGNSKSAMPGGGPPKQGQQGQ